MQNIIQKDIVIAGAGGIGLVFAIALKKYCPRLNIILIEAKNSEYLLNDERSYAIALDCLNLLQKIGIWQYLEEYANPINGIKLFDSELDEPMRINLLELKTNEKAMAYMVKTNLLHQALLNKASELNIEIIYNTKINEFKKDKVTLSNGDIFKVKLLAAADGSKSSLRKMVNIKNSSFDYKQKAIVCTIKHEYDNKNIAIQHFFKNGPFAILPLSNNKISIIWSEASDIADKIVTLNPADFLVELKKRLGNFLGQLTIEEKIQSFPLSLTLPHKFIASHFLLIGDSAHSIHPICGQGFNLGLRDCAVAAQIIVEASNIGIDIGNISLLEKYQLSRRADIIRMGFTTHFMNQLFSNDSDTLRIMRDTVLSLTNQMFNLKNYFINQANGANNKNVKLLQGEDL